MTPFSFISCAFAPAQISIAVFGLFCYICVIGEQIVPLLMKIERPISSLVLGGSAPGSVEISLCKKTLPLAASMASPQRFYPHQFRTLWALSVLAEQCSEHHYGLWKRKTQQKWTVSPEPECFVFWPFDPQMLNMRLPTFSALNCTEIETHHRLLVTFL